MNRDLLKRISLQRRREAAALLRAGLYPGSYYLSGYAVECALKACIAKQTARYDFPNRRLAQESWTHDLGRLIQLAGIADQLATDSKTDPTLEDHWQTISAWSETRRYDLSITRTDAQKLYSACVSRRGGILPWVRQWW